MDTDAPAGRPQWSTRREAVALFLRGATVHAAWRIALVVGTVLSAVNQGGVILGGDATAVTWARVVVNYLVPFVVSSLGFLAACRRRVEPPSRPTAGTGGPGQTVT